MDSPSSYRYDCEEEDGYQSTEETTDVLPDSQSEGYGLELESMTGKGINRLCSELLELKKASGEDLQKSIFSNYSAFLRIFEEYGGIESEIMKMKNYVSTQKLLVEELMNSFLSEIVLAKLEIMKDECVEDLDLDFPSWLETRMQNILETLDILMSEHRMEEALVILEKETQSLQKLQKEKERQLPIINSFAHAILDWRTRLAEQFASLAGHKRVTWPELYNALFGLCRLNESDRASVLLLNYFHSQLENSVNELKCFEPCPGIYILELTKVVFSTISQATKSSALLFGEASPYSSDLMRWARVELEVIYHSFDMHAISISETSIALGLAAETMNLSFSFCSSLEHNRLGLRSDVIKLMKPCITKVLRMHFNQLRKVVSLFSSTDNWVLGKFPLSGKLNKKPPLQEINGKLDYFQLTSSGRKFITLIQMVLDEVSPFHTFHIENLVLKGLNDLFGEYTLNLERALKISGHIEECDFPSIISAQKLQQQISILFNSFVLVQLLPTIIQDSFSATIFSSDLLLEEDWLSSQKELDLWKQAIRESSDRLKCCFCQLFVSGIMCRGNSTSMKDLGTCCCGHCLSGSSDDPMPSFVFQELFAQVRQLDQLFKSMLLVEDGMRNSLLNGIMTRVIVCLSENWDFLESTQNPKQMLLNVHFLMEIARAGDYLSDDLMAVALDLFAIMKGGVSTGFGHLNNEITEEGWASNAAKLAIKSLIQAEMADAEFKKNLMIDCVNECSEVSNNHEVTQEELDEPNWNEEDDLVTGMSSVTVNDSIVHSREDSTKLMTQINIIQPHQNPITGTKNYSGYDDKGSRISTDCIIYVEDEQPVAGTDTISDRLSETLSIDELDVDDVIIIPEEESGWDTDSGTTDLQEIGKFITINESERNKIEMQLPGAFENVEHDGNLGQSIEDYAHYDVSNEGEMPTSKGQHSQEKASAEANGQNDRTKTEHEMNTNVGQHFELKLVASNEKDLFQERISIDECREADPTTRVRSNSKCLLGANDGQERQKHVKHLKAAERLKHGHVADGLGKNKKADGLGKNKKADSLGKNKKADGLVKNKKADGLVKNKKGKTTLSQWQ